MCPSARRPANLSFEVRDSDEQRPRLRSMTYRPGSAGSCRTPTRAHFRVRLVCGDVTPSQLESDRRNRMKGSVSIKPMSMDKDVKTYYDEHYEEINFEGVGGAATRFTEAALERKFGSSDFFPRVLELGAAHGEHFPYVNHGFDQYILSDLTPHECDIAALVQKRSKRLGTPAPPEDSVKYELANAEQLPYDDNSIDRILCTCLLHHLQDPDAALKDWRRVVKPGGVVSIYLQNDPGMMVRYTRHLTTHRRSRKVAAANADFLPTKYLWAREHRNHVLGLKQLIKYNFADDTVDRWSFPFGPAASWNFNFFSILHITINK